MSTEIKKLNRFEKRNNQIQAEKDLALIEEVVQEAEVTLFIKEHRNWPTWMFYLTDGSRVDYYPHTLKWQYRGKMGNVRSHREMANLVVIQEVYGTALVGVKKDGPQTSLDG